MSASRRVKSALFRKTIYSMVNISQIYKSCRTIALATLIIVVNIPCGALSAQLSTPDEVVWHWFNKCGDAKKLTVEITLNNKSIYKSSFPICQLRRGDISYDPDPKRLVFILEKAEKQSLFGELKDESLEGNIWKAGGDSNYIILGVSFSAKKRVWLNTLHIAYPDKASNSVMANDLIIDTYPEHGRVERK